MKRRNWLIALLAPAAGAQVATPNQGWTNRGDGSGKSNSIPSPTAEDKIAEILKGNFEIMNLLRERVITIENKSLTRPVNGQCPVCRTMAKKEQIKLEGSQHVCSVIVDLKDGPTGMYECEKQGSTITRCTHCSAAFFQDAMRRW